VCLNNPFFICGSNAECDYYGIGGFCSAALAVRTPVHVSPRFRRIIHGSLRCFAIQSTDGEPGCANDLKGEAVVLTGSLVRQPT